MKLVTIALLLCALGQPFHAWAQESSTDKPPGVPATNPALTAAALPAPPCGQAGEICCPTRVCEAEATACFGSRQGFCLACGQPAQRPCTGNVCVGDRAYIRRINTGLARCAICPTGTYYTYSAGPPATCRTLCGTAGQPACTRCRKSVVNPYIDGSGKCQSCPSTGANYEPKTPALPASCTPCGLDGQIPCLTGPGCNIDQPYLLNSVCATCTEVYDPKDGYATATCTGDLIGCSITAGTADDIVQSFGQGATQIYGQLFTPGAASISGFSIDVTIPSSLTFTGNLYAWDAAAFSVQGSSLYTSSVTTSGVDTTTTVAFTFAPVTLAAGTTYVMFLRTEETSPVGVGTFPSVIGAGGYVFRNSFDATTTWENFYKPDRSLVFTATLECPVDVVN